MNDQSGLATPVPIPNTEVKQANVPDSTVLSNGKFGKSFITFF